MTYNIKLVKLFTPFWRFSGVSEFRCSEFSRRVKHTYKLEYFPHFKKDRIIISDNSGNIVGDSDDELINHNIAELDDIDSTPIIVSDAIIGELYILKTHDEPDEKFMIPHPYPPGSPQLSRDIVAQGWL